MTITITCPGEVKDGRRVCHPSENEAGQHQNESGQYHEVLTEGGKLLFGTGTSVVVAHNITTEDKTRQFIKSFAGEEIAERATPEAYKIVKTRSARNAGIAAAVIGGVVYLYETFWSGHKKKGDGSSEVSNATFLGTIDTNHLPRSKISQ